MRASTISLLLGVAAPAIAAAAYVTRPSTPTTVPPASAPRRYGAAIAIGRGHVRTYVVPGPRGTVLEVGVALDEGALDGLPAPSQTASHEGHMDMHMRDLPMPAGHGTPYRFVQFGWNPGGHEPAGVYDVPHFDFHFYTVPSADVAAVVPTDPRWAAKANRLPNDTDVPAGYAPAMPPGAAPADVAVPTMGLHWTSATAPELQKAFGKPEAWRPFTATFIYGSWDGRFTFLEPMITRAHLLERRSAEGAARDQVIAISTPARVAVPGQYPTAYRILWDDAAREYRVALTRLVAR